MADLDTLHNRKYDILDPIIEDVHNECVKMEKNEKKLLVQRFQRVMEKLIDEMKRNPEFKDVYQRIGFTGSFYDGLRVKESTEFDLNLILNPQAETFIDKNGCMPGYIGIKITKPDVARPTERWIRNGFLLPTFVRKWLKSVTTKALTNLNHKIEDCMLFVSESGPAYTLIVRSDRHPAKEMSIDLVPVIEFPSSKWPPHSPRKPKNLLGNTFEAPWFAVPKGDDNWRISFPQQEQYIIKKLNFYKYTLRLMKEVRDKLEISQVASYHIKTLFMWELEKSGQEIWSNTRRGRLFMHMIKRFRDMLCSERLPFYWDANQNLIGNISPHYLKNSYGRVKNFIDQIEKHVNANNSKELRIFIKGALKAPSVMQPVMQQEVSQANQCVLS